MLAPNNSLSCVKFNIKTIAKIYIISLLNHIKSYREIY